MSYILEALKKSDQQRQRGTTPTLQAVQITVAVPKRPLFVYYGLLAAALLGIGIMIGWLHPWQPEQPPSEADRITAKSPILISQQTAPAPLPLEMPSKTAREFPALNPTPVVQPAPMVETLKQVASAPVSIGSPGAVAPMPEKAPSSTDAAQESRVVPVAELPLQIQQEIPEMAVQLHAYSSNPAERLVSINSIRLREGGSLAPDLRLEQITPDGMIFNYKGFRFQRGIR